MSLPIEFAWRPQVGPQQYLVKCPLREVFFGGARGGGKTDGVLGKWALKEARYGTDFNGVMFRRTTVSAEDAVERSKQIYGPLGGKFNESKLRWRMPRGGRVSFAYLDKVSDADEYQGRNITDAWVEEAGQYPAPDPIDRLFGVLRSAKGVPSQLILTGNPGGAGQHWLRERYRLHPFPQGPKIYTRTIAAKDGAKLEHRFAVVPSRITDNRILIENDPGYVLGLHLVGSSKLVAAWLDGDWTAIEGAFFEEWDESKHVLTPFTLPDDWLRFRSGDWGSAAPFSFGWWAVVGDDYEIPRRWGAVVGRGAVGGTRNARLSDVHVLPRGAIVRYREWYGARAPGKGLKLTAEQAADGLIAREKTDPKLRYGVLDPACWAESGGPSIAERINTRLIRAEGGPFVSFRPADNKRVSRTVGDPTRGGPMGGWDAMRARLVGDELGRPMLYYFSSCKDSIRTIPTLQHDPTRSEDLDTDAEDHAADDSRYACMSRPWVPAAPEIEEPRDAYRDAQDDTDRGSVLTL